MGHPGGGRWTRPIYLAAGWLFTLLGILGVILPLMPGTVFLILAAFCFSRSSSRFESWLIGHPWLGPHVRRWRKTGSISRRAKFIACGSMATSFVLVVLTGAPPIAVIATAICLLGSALYVATRPEA